MLCVPDACLMDKRFMNRNDRHWNLDGPQSRQISATRGTETADNTNWTIEVDAGEIDAGTSSHGYHHLLDFSIGRSRKLQNNPNYITI